MGAVKLVNFERKRGGRLSCGKSAANWLACIVFRSVSRNKYNINTSDGSHVILQTLRSQGCFTTKDKTNL